MAERLNNTVDKIRALQHKLYRAAKRSPNRRFHALYDRTCLAWSGARRRPALRSLLDPDAPGGTFTH